MAEHATATVDAEPADDTGRTPVPSRPRLRPSVRVIARGDDRLEVEGAPGLSPRVVLRDTDGLRLRLLELLDGRSDIDRIGLVEDAAVAVPAGMNATYLDRFDRQISFLSDLETADVSRFDLQERLRTAHVVLVGLGGAGCWCALSLAAAGIGRLTGIDFDTIELSNLNLHVLFGPADVGRKKIDVAREALERFRPDLDLSVVDAEVDSPEALGSHIDGAQIVICAADRPVGQIAGWVASACHDAGTPYLLAGSRQGAIVVGPLVVPGETACPLCAGDGARNVTPRQLMPSDSQMAMATGGGLALEAVKFLLGEAPVATRGAAVVADLTTREVERNESERNPECGLCGGGR